MRDEGLCIRRLNFFFLNLQPASRTASRNQRKKMYTVFNVLFFFFSFLSTVLRLAGQLFRFQLCFLSFLLWGDVHTRARLFLRHALASCHATRWTSSNNDTYRTVHHSEQQTADSVGVGKSRGEPFGCRTFAMARDSSPRPGYKDGVLCRVESQPLLGRNTTEANPKAPTLHSSTRFASVVFLSLDCFVELSPRWKAQTE